MNLLEVAHAYDTQQAEEGGSLQVQGQPGYTVRSGLARATCLIPMLTQVKIWGFIRK